MSVVFVVLPLALLFAAGAVGAFVWAVRQGQLDDLETPAIRVALEDSEKEERASAADRRPERSLVSEVEDRDS